MTSKIHNLSGKVIKNCSYVIEAAKQEELAVGCPVVDFSSQGVIHDPCERPKVLNDEQRRFLIQRGPCQPRLKSFLLMKQLPKISKTSLIHHGMTHSRT